MAHGAAFLGPLGLATTLGYFEPHEKCGLERQGELMYLAFTVE